MFQSPVHDHYDNGQISRHDRLILASGQVLDIVYRVWLYFGTLPIAEALVQKGVGVGTAHAFMMSVTALSLPSMIMLKRVVKLPLLSIQELHSLIFAIHAVDG